MERHVEQSPCLGSGSFSTDQIRWEQSDDLTTGVISLDEQMTCGGCPQVELKQVRTAIFGDHEIEPAESSEPESPHESSRRLSHAGMVDDAHHSRWTFRLCRLNDLEAPDCNDFAIEASDRRDCFTAAHELLGVHNRSQSAYRSLQRPDIGIEDCALERSDQPGRIRDSVPNGDQGRCIANDRHALATPASVGLQYDR
jgi:hypothetical protein